MILVRNNVETAILIQLSMAPAQFFCDWRTEEESAKNVLWPLQYACWVEKSVSRMKIRRITPFSFFGVVEFISFNNAIEFDARFYLRISCNPETGTCL